MLFGINGCWWNFFNLLIIMLFTIVTQKKEEKGKRVRANGNV